MNRLLSDSVTCEDRGCFLGESSLKSRSGGLTVAVIFFSSQTSFLLVTDAVLGQKFDEESVGQTGA